MWKKVGYKMNGMVVTVAEKRRKERRREEKRREEEKREEEGREEKRAV